MRSLWLGQRVLHSGEEWGTDPGNFSPQRALLCPKDATGETEGGKF